MTRDYISNDLWSAITSDIGAIAVHPLRTDTINVDAAKSNHKPAMRSEGEHGSTVLDIGHGVRVRAHCTVRRTPDGWKCDPTYSYVSREQGGDATLAQRDRALTLISSMVDAWAREHEDVIAEADRIDRNNNARKLEEDIAEHVAALKILRKHLRRCERGHAYETYPDLSTTRR